jgi:hypothetical protein
MRIGLGTLFLFLGLMSPGAWTAAAPLPRAEPTPVPSPSPSPSPRYKLLPYGFETAAERSQVPLLRFEDRTEVRSLEMNAAIARFFDKSTDKGNMLRGATPGGAPTLRDMAPYRPHVTPGVNLLGVAAAAVQEIKKQIDKRKGMAPVDPSPSPAPSPTPTPARRPVP